MGTYLSESEWVEGGYCFEPVVVVVHMCRGKYRRKLDFPVYKLSTLINTQWLVMHLLPLIMQMLYLTISRHV